MTARYEVISGGRGKRLEHYLARRYLNISPEEWDRLPWYLHRMYIEGFEEEGLVESNGRSAQAPREHTSVDQHERDGFKRVAERTHREGRNVVTDREYHTGLSNVPGEFGALGFKERTLS